MLDLDDNCLVCLKTGRNFNIFSYNVCNISGKEELYVEVIKNCYNIEIAPDSGLAALCEECSMKLKCAYNFRHEILQAKERLISAQAAVTNNKQCCDIEYLVEMPFNASYDIDTVLDSETGEMPYSLDEIYNGKEINENDEPNFLLQLDNDSVVDKVFFDNDNVSEIMQNNDIEINKAGSDLDLVPNDSYLLDKPVENYSINILSDILVDNDLEPGEIRVIDKTDQHYLIDAHHDVIVDKKKVIIKSKGKLNAKENMTVKNMRNLEADPVVILDNIPEVITHDSLDEKDEASNGNIDKKCVIGNVKNKDKTEHCQAVTINELNTKDLIKNKKNVVKRVVKVKKDEISLLAQICTKLQNPDESSVKEENAPITEKESTIDKSSTKDLNTKKVVKRAVKVKKDEMSCTELQIPDENFVEEVKNPTAKDESTIHKSKTKDLAKTRKKVVKVKKDEISLLAQICTKQQNPDENTVNTINEINNPKISAIETKDESPDFVDTDSVDTASKKGRSRKRKKKNAGTKEASVKENVSRNVEEVKAKKPRKEKKPKPSPPFTLRPDQTACDLCSARFETQRALSNHMNGHYPQFSCGECGLELATKNRLRQHLRVHEEGPFLCKVCDKEFSNVNTRNAHTWRVHSKADPFKCRHCSLRFPTFLQRLRHVQSAHGETPEYVCQFCKAKFAYAANRTKHIRTVHLNERPHQCQHCPSAFARARNLAAHLASKHGEGEKAYRCPICGISFYFRNALRFHVSQHSHKFPCSQCDQKFATSAELESHRQIHEHADNMAINLDFVTSLHLDALADDYALIDPSYLDMNEL